MKQKAHNPWFILVLLALAQFMVVLDTSIVNVALPELQRALHFSPTALQWVVTAYTLTVGGFLLLGGRAADLYGRKKMFLTGVTLFTIASLLDGLSGSSTMLIVMRALQGLSAAFMSPAALSIILITFREGAERNKALAVWGAVASGGAAAGVLLGGLITEYLGWRWNFFINVPVGIAVITTAMRVLPAHESESRDNNLDLPGAISVTGAMMSLVYGLVEAPTKGWTSASSLGFFIASAVLFAFFIFNEQRVKHPLMPLSIFKVRNVVGANLSQISLMAAMLSVFYFSSLYIQQLLHYSPVKTGLSFLAIPISIAITATNAPRLIKQVGYKRVLMFAPLLVAGGLLWLAHVPLNGNYWTDILPGFVLMGLGMGFTFVSTTIAATSGVSPDKSGLASGLLNTSQQLGGSLGLAILAGVASSMATNYMKNHMTMSIAASPEAGKLAIANATLHGYHGGFYVAAGFAVAASLFATFVIRHAKGGADPVAEPVVAAH